jgi:hypothetical protein
MDVFMTTMLLDPARNKDNETTGYDGFDWKGLVKFYGYMFFSAFVSLYAAHLSWECNSGSPFAFRILLAMVAAFFGTLYLLYFAIFNWSKCGRIVKSDFGLK